MQPSIERTLMRSIAAKAKIVRCTASDVGATRTIASGSRIFSATSAQFNRNAPYIPLSCTTSPIQHQLQVVRSKSSSVGDTTTAMVLKESYEYIVVDATTHPGVGIITLHRPKALNALCDGLFADLIHAATVLDQNHDDIGCMVLTGSTKAFAAGADIGEMKDRTFDYAYTKVSLRFNLPKACYRSIFTVIICLFYRMTIIRICSMSGPTSRKFRNQLSPR